METKGTPEKDKLGQLGILVWLTNQNVKDLKEAVNKYVQDNSSEKDDPLIKRLDTMNNQLHEFWTVLNPS